MGGKVSIIVPVYNVEQYLDRCVASLVAQTYPNIEIILVDDGATDSSGRMCDQWQTKDERIRVVHKANGGLSDARNAGFQVAGGDYICFIDSDDWVDEAFLEVLKSTLERTDADIAECALYATVGEEYPHEGGIGELPVSTYSGDDCFYQFIRDTFHGMVWDKLYRKELLENEPFRVGAFHEDEFWTYRIFGKARKVSYVDYVGYYYFQRPGSIMHSNRSLKKLSDRLDAQLERIAFTDERFPQYRKLIYENFVFACMHIFSESRYTGQSERRAFQKKVMVYSRQVFRTCRTIPGGALKTTMRLAFFNLFPRLYCRLTYGAVN